MTDDELDLVETKRITEALGRRFPSFLLICESPTKDKSEDSSQRELSYSGGYTSAIGLAAYAQYRLLRAMHDPLVAGD